MQVAEEDGSLGWSPVYLFPHFIKEGAYPFVRLTTVGGSVVRCRRRHRLQPCLRPLALDS